ncbi:Transcriptional regulator [Tumidithrix helvetica PCC 7403]|uniref:DUF5340 family protein n=1 Tax=Tumidithrix helvetica TaxID=3457545 RepID=UPI003CB41927
MESLPVPSHIHYELLLQLLERQTLGAIHNASKQPHLAPTLKASREHIQSAIIMLRKAMVLQKQFEEVCEYNGIPISYRWSLNETEVIPDVVSPDKESA